MSGTPIVRSPSERELLVRQQLFRNVSLEAIECHLEGLQERVLAAGEVLLYPGQTNSSVFLLVEGRLRVHLDSLDAAPLLLLEEGECVGEMSIIEDNITSAFVVAHTDCRLRVLSDETLWALVNASHGVARNLLYILSKRVRFDNDVIVDGRQVQRQWEHYATVDALTGLHNRRWLDEILQRQVRRCHLSGQPLSLIMLDIDRFKRYNDEHGHLAGDRALCAVARLFQDLLRPTDLAARFGGEELVCVLPDTTLEEACRIAERLRVAVSQAPIAAQDGEPLPAVTVSLGVASLIEGQDMEALLAAADAALYRAKAKGRDRVST